MTPQASLLICRREVLWKTKQTCDGIGHSLKWRSRMCCFSAREGREPRPGTGLYPSPVPPLASCTHKVFIGCVSRTQTVCVLSVYVLKTWTPFVPYAHEMHRRRSFLFFSHSSSFSSLIESLCSYITQTLTLPLACSTHSSFSSHLKPRSEYKTTLKVHCRLS